MADIVDPATRSRMMAGIGGKNTKPEMRVRRYLHRHGLRFRLHDKKLPGRPDLVFPRYRTAVFVHGCFWHQHPGCRFAYMPSSNEDFWRAKLNRNVTRDAEKQAELVGAGWRVLTVWECETGSEVALQDLADRIRRAEDT
jgi:DNA mismatch endonuclease (patch repair protein)